MKVDLVHCLSEPILVWAFSLTPVSPRLTLFRCDDRCFSLAATSQERGIFDPRFDLLIPGPSVDGALLSSPSVSSDVVDNAADEFPSFLIHADDE